MAADSLTIDRTVLDLLRRIDFLHVLKMEDLEFLSTLVFEKTVEPEEIVFRKDDLPDAFYILASGSVEIISESLEEPEVIATLGRAGDYFGEIGLIDDSPRPATVKAADQSRLLVLTRDDFNRLRDENAIVFHEISNVLAHGLRQSDSRYTETILKKNRQLAEAIKNLKEAQEELLRQERLSLVGRLASGIIHDLKKPMTCISGYAQLLEVKAVKDDKRRRYAEKITQEVHRLVDMVNEILQFARGEQKISPTNVNLEEWLNDVVGLLERDFRECNIKFKKTITYKEDLFIDCEKFKSVFFNIAGNAVTAMPDGGIFTFKCSQKGDKVKLDFIDNGLGMGEDAKAHVFKDFFSQSKDGTGLGMAIVKRIVEAHGGTISVESELSRGTKFTILLPLEEP